MGGLSFRNNIAFIIHRKSCSVCYRSQLAAFDLCMWASTLGQHVKSHIGESRIVSQFNGESFFFFFLI